jgi:hypothetical protein
MALGCPAEVQLFGQRHHEPQRLKVESRGVVEVAARGALLVELCRDGGGGVDHLLVYGLAGGADLGWCGRVEQGHGAL